MAVAAASGHEAYQLFGVAIVQKGNACTKTTAGEPGMKRMT